MKPVRGFTLMEMLVTLIITALAVALMFQALASFNISRERTAATEGVRDNRAVMASWIGDTIHGIVAIDPRSLAVSHAGDPDIGLTGDPSGFTALTLAPLQSGPGVPTVIRWQVEHGAQGDALAYSENGGPALTLPMGDAVQFAYIDDQGHLHSQWPPREGAQKALPEAIELTWNDSGQPHALAAAIAAPRPSLLNPYNLEEGLQ